jgi:hypothetical protein
VGGLHKNPITVALPRSNPLPRATITRWQQSNGAILAQLDALSNAQVAQASTASTQPRLAP